MKQGLAGRIEATQNALTSPANMSCSYTRRRGYAGPCPSDKKCPACKLIKELEEVKL
jgi:hypothetical protein